MAGTQPAIRAKSALAALAMPLCLAACASGSASTQGIYDPFEPANRAVHALNKGLDRALVSPGADAYGVVPEPVRQSLSNLADTLSLPGSFANHLLQGNVEGAGRNAAQFAVNAVFGLGGLLDVATEAGIPRDKTDFGETLHVWGVGEGPYVELPILGPSTARDAVGEVVDIVLDPLNGVFEGDDAMAVRVLKALSRLNDRKRYSNTVDSILYDSADSYAQARLLYLQNRRFELGETSGDTGSGAGDDGFIDPYEDPYGQ